MTPSDCLKTLIAKMLSKPDKLEFTEVVGAGQIVYCIKVHPIDYGRVLGKKAETLFALSTTAGLLHRGAEKQILVRLANNEHPEAPQRVEMHCDRGYSETVYQIASEALGLVTENRATVSRIENGNIIAIKTKLPSGMRFYARNDAGEDELKTVREVESALGRVIEVVGKSGGWEAILIMEQN